MLELFASRRWLIKIVGYPPVWGWLERKTVRRPLRIWLYPNGIILRKFGRHPRRSGGASL